MILAALIFLKSLSLSLEKNGGRPVNISKMIAPNDHQSTAFPCPRFSITSGARYSGVPQKECALWLSFIPCFESPKSVTLIYPSRSIRTFSGLRLLINKFIW